MSITLLAINNECLLIRCTSTEVFYPDNGALRHSAAIAKVPSTGAVEAAPLPSRPVESFPAPTTFTALTLAIATIPSPEEIQSIADMDDGIRRDGVYLAVCPPIGVDRSREIGLFTQDVVPLQHDG